MAITDFSDKSTEWLESFRDDTARSLAEVSSALGAAKATMWSEGKYADPVWFSKASAAKKFLGLDHQRVLQELSRRKKSRPFTFGQKFIDVAREYLDTETFTTILHEASRRQVEESGIVSI